MKQFDFVRATLRLFKAVPHLEGENFQQYNLDNEKKTLRKDFLSRSGHSRLVRASPIKK